MACAGHLLFRYEYEGLALAGVLLYLAVFLIGRSKNRKIASSLLSQIRTTLEEQFSRLGLGTGAGQGNTDVMSLYNCESVNEYKFYATGRRHCRGMSVELNLRKRQDLFGLAYELMYPQTDTCIVEIPMHEKEVEPFVFVLCHEREKKTYIKYSRDVTDYATELKNAPRTYKLDDDLVVCSS